MTGDASGGDARRAKPRAVGLPRGLADEIRRFLDDHPWVGHDNLSSFAEDAVRRHLRRLREVVGEDEPETGP